MAASSPSGLLSGKGRVLASGHSGCPAWLCHFQAVGPWSSPSLQLSEPPLASMPACGVGSRDREEPLRACRPAGSAVTMPQDIGDRTGTK